MPLTEISANVRRDGSQSQRSTRASSQGRSPKKVKPDAVSSMLRTSTETGDIGQFSVRPSRIPRSASRLPPRNRPGTLTAPAASSRTSARRPVPRYDSRRLPRPVPSYSALSRQDTVRSSLTSYHSDPRTRCRTTPRGPYGTDRRASPANVPGLYSHPSFMTLRTRPGYRPGSPAYSDAHSMPVYDRRPGFHRAASVATAASSPASRFNRDFPSSYRGMNNSASSLRRFPSPAMSGFYPGVQQSPFPSRHATPASASVHHATRHPNVSVESFQTIPRSTTGSTTPLYYDYTEAFAHEYGQFSEHVEPISPLFSADHAIPEQDPVEPARQAQTPFGIVQGSIFKPSEMPTQHNRTRSEQSKESFRHSTLDEKVDLKETKQGPKDRPEKAQVRV
jgi:hypothetical protein